MCVVEAWRGGTPPHICTPGPRPNLPRCTRRSYIDAYTLNPPHLRSASLDHDQCAAVHMKLIDDAAPSGLLGGASSSTAVSVLQYEHYELDNMTEAFGKLAF
jgi:hypothetical protein